MILIKNEQRNTECFNVLSNVNKSICFYIPSTNIFQSLMLGNEDDLVVYVKKTLF